MIVYFEGVVRQEIAGFLLYNNKWSSELVDKMTPIVMLRMKNKGYIINGAYSEKALRDSINASIISVDSEDESIH